MEIGYISHVEEEKYLKSKVGQDNISNAIVKAFVDYKLAVDKTPEMQRVIQEKVVEEAKPEVAEKKSDKVTTNVSKTVTKGLVYAIQVCSSTSKMKTFGHINLKTEISELYSEGRYRYYVYPSGSYDEIVKQLANVRRSVKDCFPIAIYNGKLISVSKAKELSK